MKLSVIITTSPGREEHLMYCLTMLVRQTHQDFEVLVMDDGSTEGERVCRLFRDRLELRYYYRANDRCVSRSRNLGARAALTPYLVYLDVDMLLNPFALAAYHEYFTQHPNQVVFGYMGYNQDFVAPSQWFPECAVNFLDIRFNKYSKTQLACTEQLLSYPHLYALGANMAFSKDILEAVGGFNEAYDSWGQEDLELAYGMIKAGYQIHFSLDAWGEHQYHARSGTYHDQSLRQTMFKMDDIKVDYAVKILASKAIVNDLLERVLNYYGQHTENLSQSEQEGLKAINGCLSFPDNYTPAVFYQHVRLPQDKKVDFMVLGGTHCGAEELFEDLVFHSKIAPPHSEPTVHYFDQEENLSRSEGWYHDQFPCFPHRLRGEVSTDYFYAEHVALRMAKYNSALKIVFVLREPLERAWAEYLENFPEAEPEAFAEILENSAHSEAAELFLHGKYVVYLSAFKRHFSQDQILILDYQDLQVQRGTVLKQVYTFLGLSSDVCERLTLAELAQIKPLPLNVQQKLSAVYQSANRDLKNMLSPLKWLKEFPESERKEHD